MKIRGLRECDACGTRWSYYRTGSVRCPDCGSLRSVGTDDDRREHTDSPVALDLDSFRGRLSDEPLDAVAADLKRELRAYTRKRGFINAGELRDLDDTYLVARELLHVVDILSRARQPTDEEELYLIDLYEAAVDGGRPAGSRVPRSLTAARGAAAVDAVEAYRRDLSTWLDDRPNPPVRRTLETLRDHLRQAHALDGDISLTTAAALVAAARDLGRALRENGDGSALESARSRLAELD
ncbi:DUF7117 family protein [Haloferacaceae archaeon DSL9]